MMELVMNLYKSFFSLEYMSDLSQIKKINTGCCISVEDDLVISPSKGKNMNY
jgi:hypothetical protein